VAVLDIGLPRLDGYEVARRVRPAVGGEVRLIALTGHGAAEDRQRAFAAGFDHHLTKPADPEELRRLVATA
jgi:CheY-like chemotaxis protein